MNTGLILQPLFDMLKWLLPLMVTIQLLRTRRFKGWFGEQLVRLSTHLLLDRHVYRRLHDVTLQTPDGTTQIDHVFVSPFGVFVLETKNMKGWIFGGEKQTQWTQQLFRKRFQFQNPLLQNYKHVKALQAALQIGPEHVHSVIAFVGGSKFKNAMPANVTQGAGAVRYIKSFRQAVFTEAQVAAMLEDLKTSRLASTFATRKAHIEQLNKRDDPTASRLCPRCGNALVVRIYKTGSKTGQRFWGCSTYPKCRTRQSLTSTG